jgi:Fur family transcriptional regulator, ferric uptake regulator
LTPQGGQRHTSRMRPGEPKGVRAGDEPKGPDVVRLRGQLDSFMAQQGLRSTGQRRLIIESFFSATGHVTIEDLLERVRRDDPGIGYATVYRTMKMLAEGRIANEHKFSDGMTRYELADDTGHHDHLICVECGRIQEFEEPLIEELQERIAARYGFSIIEHKHELYGICSAHVREAETDS